MSSFETVQALTVVLDRETPAALQAVMLDVERARMMAEDIRSQWVGDFMEIDNMESEDFFAEENEEGGEVETLGPGAHLMEAHGNGWTPEHHWAHLRCVLPHRTCPCCLGTCHVCPAQRP